MSIEELRVVVEAVAGRQARRGGRILRIKAGDDAEHDRGIGDGPRERAGGVLIRGDRNDAVAADQADRRLDADQAVGRSRAEDRAGRFRADPDGGEVRGDGDPGPELDPPGVSAGRPSLNGRISASSATRGSGRGSYGLKP